MMKRAIALFLAFCTIFALASCTGAEEKYEPEDFVFTLRTPASSELGFENGYTFVTLNDGTAMITEANVKGDITIPSELSGKKVTAIGEGAFFGLTEITSVVIPDSVCSIGIYAFSDCTALESVTVPTSVWNIAPFAFDSTPWLASQTDEFVTVGDSVLIAYNGNSLTPVLPEYIRHLGGAFAGNGEIRSLTLNREVLTVSDMALTFCANLGSVELGLSLVYAGEQAFSGSESLNSVIFPDTLRYLGKQAFLNCYGIKYIHLGQSLMQIGEKAFEYCQALRTVYLPNTITELRSSYFTDCASLCLILYGGSESEFEAVAINDNVNSFNRINKVYNYTGGINE